MNSIDHWITRSMTLLINRLYDLPTSIDPVIPRSDYTEIDYTDYTDHVIVRSADQEIIGS